MRIVILNWKNGENDPFTYFCSQLKGQLTRLGHDVGIVTLDENVGHALHQQHSEKALDLAITWQGLGSQSCPVGSDRTLWELLDLPLLCLHGDQPAYNPVNHQQSSRHLIHIYPSPAFASDANALIARDWPALAEDFPNMFLPPDEVAPFEGNYFVFPKNITDVEDMKAGWRARCNARTAEMLCRGADAIMQEFRRDHLVSHHDVILDQLPAPIPTMVRTGRADASIAKVVFTIKRELDPVYRNSVAGFIVDSLPHVPLQVNGRGWERYASRNNPNHSFQEFGRLADGEGQFRSKYGILDAAPSNDLIHDRMVRAMVRGTGFLSNVAFRHGQPIYEEFRDLFFSGDEDELVSRVQTVMADPVTHRARVRMFSEVYDAVFPFSAFFDRLTDHVRKRGFNV